MDPSKLLGNRVFHEIKFPMRNEKTVITAEGRTVEYTRTKEPFTDLAFALDAAPHTLKTQFRMNQHSYTEPLPRPLFGSFAYAIPGNLPHALIFC